MLGYEYTMILIILYLFFVGFLGITLGALKEEKSRYYDNILGIILGALKKKKSRSYNNTDVAVGILIVIIAILLLIM